MTCACRKGAVCLDCLEFARVLRRVTALRARLDRIRAAVLPPWPPERRESA